MLMSLVLTAVTTASAASVAPQVDVDLVVVDAAESVVDAAIRLRIEKPWHVYWHNPGDSGLAVRVLWTLPEGAHAEDLAWPVPLRFFDGTFATYGYADAVALTTRLHGVSASDPIQAEVRWLACDAICVPGKQRVVATAPAEAAAVITEARNHVPQAADPAQLQVASVIYQDGILTVTLAGPAAPHVQQVFPETVSDVVIAHGSITVADAIIRIPMHGHATSLPLVLATTDGPRRLVVDLPTQNP